MVVFRFIYKEVNLKSLTSNYLHNLNYSKLCTENNKIKWNIKISVVLFHLAFSNDPICHILSLRKRNFSWYAALNYPIADLKLQRYKLTISSSTRGLHPRLRDDFLIAALSPLPEFYVAELFVIVHPAATAQEKRGSEAAGERASWIFERRHVRCQFTAKARVCTFKLQVSVSTRFCPPLPACLLLTAFVPESHFIAVTLERFIFFESPDWQIIPLINRLEITVRSGRPPIRIKMNPSASCGSH